MKQKTSGLTGIALDWAVATAEGAVNFRYDTVATYWVTLNGKDRALGGGWAQSFQPSSNWAHGGPIIEREGITVGRQVHRTEWSAEAFDGSGMSMTFLRFGPTPLIAAMRCYVTSKLGDEVDVKGALA